MNSNQYHSKSTNFNVAYCAAQMTAFLGSTRLQAGIFLSGGRARPLKLPLFVNIENISCIKAF